MHVLCAVELILAGLMLAVQGHWFASATCDLIPLMCIDQCNEAEGNWSQLVMQINLIGSLSLFVSAIQSELLACPWQVVPATTTGQSPPMSLQKNEMRRTVNSVDPNMAGEPSIEEYLHTDISTSAKRRTQSVVPADSAQYSAAASLQDPLARDPLCLSTFRIEDFS